MSEDHDATFARRRFLKLVGSSAVIVPIVGLTACSGGEDSAPKAAKPKVETDAPPAKPVEKPAEKPSAGGGMAKLSEDDPQAKSLAYVHDATQVDGSKQARYKPGQICENCALYQAGNDAEWGGCSIFPGRQVKATGWCSVYAPKVG